ncbi:hypothetical protein IFM89_032905 [Coptis chinensis]|uniref:Replication factor A C-terminal domain-containing protein n=1 Tax=Coptis chinensis TaxID=261450 RepID=A0A835IRW4_9MAGN|nr:hypothetical protein IFM89_032905 [Coptis chinensis]
MLQGSSSIERNMKDRSLRNMKTLLQIVQMLNAEFVGQVFTCEAIIYDIVHDYAPFYKSCTKIGHRKKISIEARIRDDTESTLITIFGDEAEELLKHPASELEKLIESQLGLPRSTDIPQSSNKKISSKKPYKKNLCGLVLSTDDKPRLKWTPKRQHQRWLNKEPFVGYSKYVDGADVRAMLKVAQVKVACQKALRVEDLAKSRLREMNKELNIHCKAPRPSVKFADPNEQ